MKKKLLALGLLSLSLSSLAQEANYLTNKLMVKLAPGETLTNTDHVTRMRKLFGNVYVVETDSLYKLEDDLKNDPAVVLFERSFTAPKRVLAERVKTISLPEIELMKTKNSFNDPHASKVWSFLDASKFGVSVNKAYENMTTHADSVTIVAVVDTGVDYNHEDLKNVMWRNEKEIPGNNIDDDKNGYVDDYYGINTLQRDGEGRATGNPMDTHYHGSHVAGTIAAEQNNGKGIAGIASKVRIMAIHTVPNDGDETDLDVAESYIYAAKMGAKIINCSFGKSVNEGGQIVSEAIDFIGKNYGTLVVAAAGNETTNIDITPKYPAAYTNNNLLVIAATTNKGGLASFSNWGLKSVDVAAPGSNIYSVKPGNGYQSLSGTSMATPTTVGVLAEILSHYPNLTAEQLKEHLMKTVTKVSAFGPKMQSGGRIDLNNALNVQPPKY
ncbi:MAG: S8 family peptidase [Bacteriovoracaceae bacterium]